MITSELISYIRNQIKNNTSKDLIISKLINVGWHVEDINEGFFSIESELKYQSTINTENINEKPSINPEPVVTENNKDVVDKYHEQIEGDNIFTVENKIKKIETPIVEDKKTEIPKIEIPVVESPKTEIPKVWTPMSVPIKETPTPVISQENTKVNNIEIKSQNTQVETQNLELQGRKPDINMYSRELENKSQPQNEVKDSKTTSSVVDLQNPDKSKGFIPNLIPKMPVNSFNYENKNIPVKPENNNPVVSSGTPRSSLMNNLPKIAMLSSYQNDLLSANKINEEVVQKNKFKLVNWLIAFLIILALSVVAWAFISGYINLGNLKILNFSFIKKDPKILLLDNSKTLASLDSYKTETNIEISSPSFSNITYGLLSGEALSTEGKDFISINTLGMMAKNESGSLSDNFVTIKSSVLSDDITTDIKNNGSDLFVNVPDLSQIIKEDIIKSSIVRISKQQFELIPSLFSPKIEAQLKKVNLYNILASGIPSYINTETLNSYNELINSVEITEKESENIKGVETYHYSINADRQLAKNLLIKISDDFSLNLSEEDKVRLTDILGSINVDSFEVWVGKGDNNIYQYSISVSIPLAKVIGFGDKSIGDNKINASWKTTYYDFDGPNNIFMPEASVSASEFVENIKETKIKNNVLSFNQLATSFSNVEKSYGKNSNKSGSCMNPTSGSLFSPTGHSKNATTVVGSISSFLNSTLESTDGIGSCFSTSKAWSFAIPVNSSSSEIGSKYFFCIDSTGTTKELSALPTSAVCK